MKYPEKQVNLIYGNDLEKVNQARRELTEHYLKKEEREENYIEFSPPASRKKQSLEKIMPDLLAELGTISFFPDSRRVVVVYNLEELYNVRSKKQAQPETKEKISSEAYFIKYLEDQLPQTNNILILVNTEDYESFQRINKNSHLFRAIKKLGFVNDKCYSRPLIWELEDAFRDRNLEKTLSLFRTWLQKDEDSAKRSVFFSILKQIVLMLQAKVHLKKSNNFTSPDGDQASRILFPKELKYNLSTEQDFIQKKVYNAQKRYTTMELTTGLKKMLKINEYLYPQTSDIYVPDFQVMLEAFLVEFMTRDKKLQRK